MWTTIKKQNIPVNLTKSLKESILSAPPSCLEFDPETNEVTIEYSDEGFDFEEVQPFLKCATKSGKILVHTEDHKGENTYKITYGNGKCEDC